MFSAMKFHRLGYVRFGTVTVLASCWALQAGAQSASSPGERSARPVITSTPASAAAKSAADEARRLRVETALRLDPYFYDAHVNVLLVKGVVVLQGFVFSDWDLIDAIRIANRAAGDGRVVNALSIEVGGRR
jgi:osmotically-inducible protein OsmY